jgi:hypothetical protein
VMYCLASPPLQEEEFDHASLLIPIHL